MKNFLNLIEFHQNWVYNIAVVQNDKL